MSAAVISTPHTYASLGEVAEFINGYAFKPQHWGDAGRPIIRIQNLTDSTKPFNRTQAIVPTKYLVNPGDLLVSWSATLGVFEWSGEEALLNQHIFKVIPRQGKVNQHYLRFAIRRALDQMRRHQHGSTMEHVNRSEFLSTEIPLPALTEQARIADILNKADQIRQKCGGCEDQLIEVVNQRFRTLFSGAQNKCTLGEIGQVQGGLQVTPRRETNPLEVPYLRVANVFRDSLDLEEVKSIRVTPQEVDRVALKPGDMLIVEGHGNKTEIGKAALWNGEISLCLHQNHLIRVRVDSSTAIPEYVNHAVNSSDVRWQIARFSGTTSGLNTISAADVKALSINLPPLEEQLKFKDLIQTSRRLKSLFQQRLSAADQIYEALWAQSFGGDLR